MRILLYGEATECQQATDILQAFLRLAEGPDNIRRTDSRDALIKQIVDWDPNLIVVLADRANGMEGVYAAKETRGDIPVFWFSDDKGFGMQSHRLECDYFAVKPITREKLERAFHRCHHMGIRIAVS